MIRLLALIFCFPVAAFAQWVPYANNPITTTSVDTPSAATLYLGKSNANAVSIGNASALTTFLGGITSTAAQNAFGASSFSGAITGGQAATLGATGVTTLTASGGNTTTAAITTTYPIYVSNTNTSAFAMNSTGADLGLIYTSGSNQWSLGYGTAYNSQTGILVWGTTGVSVTGTDSSTSKMYPDTGDTPTIASGACGTTTNGSIAGNDQTGVITIGVAATTTCTVSFGATWSTAPKACLFSPNNAAAAAVTVLPYSTITNTTTWVLHGAVLASTTWNYHCF